MTEKRSSVFFRGKKTNFLEKPGKAKKDDKFLAEILKKVVEKFSAKMCSDEFFLKHDLPVVLYS